MLEIEISNRVGIDVDERKWREVVMQIVSDAKFESGSISVGVIDDQTMHRLNREHLEHDYPTDVLSFVFDRTDDQIDGEVLVSSDTAKSRCSEFGLAADEELLLYVVHGTLHLVGYNDKSDSDRDDMRRQERHYLALCGIQAGVGIADRGSA